MLSTDEQKIEEVIIGTHTYKKKPTGELQNTVVDAILEFCKNRMSSDNKGLMKNQKLHSVFYFLLQYRIIGCTCTFSYPLILPHLLENQIFCSKYV